MYTILKKTLFRNYDNGMDSRKKEDVEAAGITQEDITDKSIFRNKVLIGKLVKGKSARRPKQFGPMRGKENEAGGGVGTKKKQKL